MLTFTRISEPACNSVFDKTPRPFLLKIFSTAVKPCPFTEFSLDAAKAELNYIPRISEAKFCSFLPKTTAYDPPALINSDF